MRSRFPSRPALSVLLLSLLTSLACSDQPTEPEPVPATDDGAITQDVAVPALASNMTDQSVRVDITLIPDGLVAGVLVFDPSDDDANDEEVRGFATKISGDQTGGTLTVKMGDLEIGFTDKTEFFGTEGDELTIDEFVMMVSDALNAGDMPGVRARRTPAHTPQTPDDVTFVAEALRLAADLETQGVEMNVDHDNLRRNSDPPPDGWIVVLGLEIELRVTEGITKIQVDRPELEKVRFDDMVASVDLDGRTFTLANGDVIKVVERTRIKHWSIGNRRLSSLEAVNRALEAGLPVRARGHAAVMETETERHLVAVRVSFRLDWRAIRPFGGKVTSIDLENSTFTINEKLVVYVADFTHILRYPHHGDTPATLESASRALEAGHTVYAAGIGVVTMTDAASPSLTALIVKFAYRPGDGDGEEFKGMVVEVNVEESNFTLEDGTVINVLEDTKIVFGRDKHYNTIALWKDRRLSLEDVAAALAAGIAVHAEGKGLATGDDPLTIDAAWVRFVFTPGDRESFGGIVESVDVDEETVTLTDGTIIQIVESTIFWPPWLGPQYVPVLEVIARALDAGLTVATKGVGTIVAEEPLTIEAREITFSVGLAAVFGFKDEVTTVDESAGTFTLKGGTVIQMVEGTRISTEQGALPDLAAVQAALSNGDIVVAAGTAAVYGNDPKMAVAIEVEFRTTT